MLRVVFNILGKSYSVNFSEKDKIAKNFTIGEMANNKSAELPKLIIDEKALVFIGLVQELRDTYGKPINVNSWYRTKSFNNSCGGSSNSAHLYGLAVDFRAVHSENERKKMADDWKRICERRGVVGCINYYTHGYHVAAFEDYTHHVKTFKVYDYRGKNSDW